MVAGSGPVEAQVTEMAASSGVPLLRLGFCNQSMMPSVYAAADLLALPSSSETWGLVANEALACGKPVVVSDSCGCAPDLASDGTAGAVFRCGDVEELAAGMRRLIADPRSRDAIAVKVDHYSPAVAVEGILEAARAVRRPGRGRPVCG
jgi:glycosyltransferase involved in cell wall biosynthesis